MALIKVNEQDKSWYYRQRVSGQLAVLVPGVATFGPINDPVYLTADNFTQVLGTSSVDSRDTSYNQAASFIAAGADVLFWRLPLDGIKTASHRVVGTTVPVTSYEVTSDQYTPVKDSVVTAYVDVKAKYPGSFGNNLKYKCYRAGVSAVSASPNYRFLVYRGSQVVETLIVNFEDLDSEYYYETVNQNSNYIEFDKIASNKVTTQFLENIQESTSTLELSLPSVPLSTPSVKITPEAGEFDVSLSDEDKKLVLTFAAPISTGNHLITVDYESEGSLSDVALESPSAISLKGGSNGTYDKNFVTDSIVSNPNCQEVIQALTDPLQYSFNLMVDGGYNDYLRYIFNTTLTASLVTTTKEGTVVTDKIKVNLGCKLDSTKELDLVLEDSKGHILKDTSVELVEGRYLSFTKVTEDSSVTTESAVIDAISSGYTVKVMLKGVKESQFDRISQIDDLYIYVAENRGLAIYLVDGDRDWTPEEYFNYTDLPSNNFDPSDSLLKSSSGFNTSYGAAYGPWVSAKLTSTGVSRVLPGSYALITAWSQSIASGVPMYYAPAGVKRTKLPLVNSTVYRVDSAVNELWQSQDVTVTNGHKINPIINLRQYGYVIYGNSTLLKNQSNGVTSMLQSMSTRILANLIKQRAFDISLSLQFDQIDSDLFSQFKILLSKYMDTLKYKGALYDYLIVADYSALTLDDLNSRTVPVTIKISPNPAAENFVINLEISQAGVSFADTEGQTSSVQG